MAQGGLELTTSCLLEWSLSEFCHTDSCFPCVETRIYKDKLLFIYGPRSLLSCCTVIRPAGIIFSFGPQLQVLLEIAEFHLHKSVPGADIIRNAGII